MCAAILVLFAGVGVLFAYNQGFTNLWWGLAIAMAILFGMAALGMSGEPRRGSRPPSHPPGWRNRKRRK